MAAGGPTPIAQFGPGPALPVTTIVRFSDVKIDSRIPTLPYDNAQALPGFGGVFLVPTVFSDDAFALPSAQGAAKQYLSRCRPVRLRLYRIDIGLAASHEPLSLGQRRRAAGQSSSPSPVSMPSFSARVGLPRARPISSSSYAPMNWSSMTIERRRRRHSRTPASLGRKVLLDYERFHMNVDTTRAQLGLPPT